MRLDTISRDIAFLNFDLQLDRVDENSEERIVRAYAYVNAVVEGEGGLRLLRATMMDAGTEYFRFGNVREMHQPSAVGVIRSHTWDDKGCLVELEVVDDNAWKKVVKGVYKQLSVSVRALVQKGLDVLKCRWVETSLVDRGKDPDADILSWRFQETNDLYRVELDESETLDQAIAMLQRMAGKVVDPPAPKAPLRIETAADLVRAMMDDEDEALQRALNRSMVRTLQEMGFTVARFEGIESRLAVIGGEIAAAVKPVSDELERVKKLPQTTNLPLRGGPRGAERTFGGDGDSPNDKDFEETKSELERVEAKIKSLSDSPEKDRAIAVRLQLRRVLQSYGS